MRPFLAIVSLVAALITQTVISESPIAGDVEETKVGDLTIRDGWVRASIGQAPNSAAYMMLMTEGDTADKLIAGSSPVAEKVELHNHILEDGVAKMRQVKVIDVAPGDMTVLEPGGLHVMLMGLKDKLEDGAEVPLTLTFENAGDVELILPIRGLRHGQHKSAGHKHGS